MKLTEILKRLGMNCRKNYSWLTVLKSIMSELQRVPGIWGGSGGGIVTSDVWVHPELEKLGLGEEIREVIK